MSKTTNSKQSKSNSSSKQQSVNASVSKKGKPDQPKNTPAQTMARSAGRPKSPGRKIFALALVILGIVLLLINLNLISWSMIQSLISYWPLFLVLLGLELLIDSRWLMGLIYFLLGVSLVGLVISHAYDIPLIPGYRSFFSNLGEVGSGRSTLKPEQTQLSVLRAEYPQVKTRHLDINLGIGQLQLRDDESADLMALEATHYGRIGQPDLRTRHDRDLIEFQLDFQTGGSRFMRNFTDFKNRPEYELILGSPEIETNVDLDLGVGSANLIFEKLIINQFKFDVGIGSLTADLSSTSAPKKIEINTGVGSTKLVLPSSLGIKLNYQVGIGSIEVDGQSIKGAGSYASKNFNQAEQRVVIEADVGAGSIEIIRQ